LCLHKKPTTRKEEKKMKNELLRKRIEKMYQDYYSDSSSKIKQVNFEKRKESKIEGLISWVELPADSEMYKQNILIGKEVL
jgi:hypothetical protein